MLQGPEPNCVISRAPPSMVRFFRNITICICCIIGSLIPQNLCMGVTPIRKITISQAPSLARYPKRMESAPKSEIRPETGTRTEAIGTPCDAAKAIVWWAKWVNPDIAKMRTKSRRPRKTTGAETCDAAAIEVERFENVAAVAMVNPFEIVVVLIGTLGWMKHCVEGYNK